MSKRDFERYQRDILEDLHIEQARNARLRFYGHGEWTKETDKEWIERGGQLGIQLRALEWTKDMDDPTLKNRHQSGEMQMWQEFMVTLIMDAFGLNPGVKRNLCSRCHASQDCGCYMFFERDNGEDYVRRVTKKPCPQGHKDHTIQQCAIRFVESDPQCEAYCDMLGISISYLRQYIKKGEFKGNANKEKAAQARSIPGKSFHHTGRTSKARGADRSLQVGGKIHSGEEA